MIYGSLESQPVPAHERAVVSSLYTDSYVFAIATLGHSLRKAEVNAKKILMYMPDRISNRSLCIVKAAGWDLHPVELIPPPHNGAGIHYSFVDQYTKLSIWKLDNIGIKTAVYLDADTLVRKNFDELWNIPFEFAAVPDIYVGDAGFTIGFNAGILLFHPSTDVFNDMVAKLETAKYSLRDAEQAFLNLYFGVEALRLPYAYGGNLAIKERSDEMWAGMQKDLRIVHYTLVKPFETKFACGWGRTCQSELVFDDDRRKEYLLKAKKKWSGHFAEEISWWETDYIEMMKEIGDLCSA